jgi:asparagine synthase (glutamine-hydrolysing)
LKINIERYKWFCKDDIRVAGFILEGSEYLREERLADHFKGIDSLNDFKTKLLSSNGQFSVIIKKGNEIWAACDRLRNYPLFYTQGDKELVLSDNCYFCLNQSGIKKINLAAETAFLAAGYVPGNLTLINNVFQVEAGSYIVFGDHISTGFYHSYFEPPVRDYEPALANEDLRILLDAVFSSHLNALNDKFIAVSLSGGYDSRFVAAMAKKYHPRNMICYTYGRKNNIEAQKAGRAAKKLDVKWINIEYNSDLIKDFINDPVFRGFYPYASNLTSMFFLSDYFAVKYLKDNNIIPDNCVFIPGHSGDVLAGSHLTSGLRKPLSEIDLIRKIFSSYFRYVRTPQNKKQDIYDLIRKKIPAVEAPAWKIYENWDLKERQAKFIVNSANVYTWFGYEYALPFWDNCLIDFFSALPFKLKVNKKLYDSVLKQNIFADMDLNFSDDLKISSSKKQFQNIKDRIKPFLPYYIVTLLTDQKCSSLYDELTKQLCDDMGSDNIIRPLQANYFNSYLIQWYLFKTKELLKSKST